MEAVCQKSLPSKGISFGIKSLEKSARLHTSREVDLLAECQLLNGLFHVDWRHDVVRFSSVPKDGNVGVSTSNSEILAANSLKLDHRW